MSNIVRENARHELIKNINNQAYYPEARNLSGEEKQSDNLQLPSYIPYIGSQYFDNSFKILCYAINQNLSKHAPWSEEWVELWINNYEDAIDRLNNAALKGIPIPIKPYAEGFIPLVALIASKLFWEKENIELGQYIDDIIAVTNFVKYSTITDASSSSIPQAWWKTCGEKFVKQEIEILNPNLIIAFGNKTYDELQNILKLNRSNTKLVKCRFPARIPSNKCRILSKKEESIWSNDILPLIKRIRIPDKHRYHKFKIKQYPGYFVDFYQSIKNDCN